MKTTFAFFLFALLPFSCTKEQVQVDTSDTVRLELKATQQEIAAVIYSTRNLTEKDLKQNKALADHYYHKLADLARQFDQQQEKLRSLGVNEAQRYEIIAENWKQILLQPKLQSLQNEMSMGLSCFKTFLATLDKMNEDLIMSSLDGTFFVEVIEWYFDFKKAIKDFYACLDETYPIR